MDYEADDENDGGNGHNHGYAPAVDPFSAALVLIDLAQNPKATKVALKQLVKLDKDIGAAEAKLAAVTAQTEQQQAALDARAAELDAREAAITKREDEFAASIEEARDHLRRYHDSIAEEDRRIRYRILSSADLLHGFNSRLQDLPDWPAIKQLVPDLPADPPAIERDVSYPRIDVFSDTSNDPHGDRHGNVFLGTLSRDVSHKGAA
jgi:hypothetical protein